MPIWESCAVSQGVPEDPNVPQGSATIPEGERLFPGGRVR